ncbi:MAG: type II secretion system F family protein [Nitrospinota bacterium]
MPIFTYQATDPSGKMITGVVDAPDKAVAVELLQKDNFFPISVETEKERPGHEISFSFSRKPISQKELLNFTRQMATLLRSGLELDRCLGILNELMDKKKSREIVKSIQQAVHAGETLRGAMARQTGVFSGIYLAMVKAGETGGFLDKVFDRLAYYLESRQKLVESVRSAIIYPIVLLFAGIIAVGVLMAYVIPKFSEIFETMGGELPASTRFLVWLSSGTVDNLPWIVAAVVVLYAAFKTVMGTDTGKRYRDTMLLKLPIIGPLAQKTVVAQFTRTLGTLLQSGVPIIQSLGIVRETITNKLVADALDGTIKSVKEGQRMSLQLKATGLFPPLAVHMMLVGEESGTLDDMMIRMAAIYDDEVETAVNRLLTLLEPAMILIMGTVVAFVVISMLTAIFSVNDLPF